MSNTLIHVLDQDTINKIAAGEVVERPASVVKELVDNAIDAGASAIRIELKDSGKTLISIRDDGKGMSRDDVSLSPIKHATSKISSVTDLESIATMGFRGEALAAISSVSKFEIITKQKEDATGTRLYLEDGKQEITDIGAPDGTTVNVHTLFYNTPARLKYMKSDATEMSHIAGMVSDLILANPGISFTLINNGRTVLSSASSNLFNSIVDILGHEAARVMLEIPSENMETPDDSKKEAVDQIKSLTEYADMEITGYISKPTYSKTTADNLFFIVNNRPVTSKELVKAVRLGYYTKLPKDRYPAAVIHLKINPSEVDVNVHPRKVEVRFRDENRLTRVVSDVIETTLRLYELAPKVTASEAKKVVEKSFSDYGAPQKTAADSEAEALKPETSTAENKKQESEINYVKEKTAVYSTKPAASQTEEKDENSTKKISFGDSSLSSVSEKYGTGYIAPAKDTDKRLKATERLLSETKKANGVKTAGSSDSSSNSTFNPTSNLTSNSTSNPTSNLTSDSSSEASKTPSEISILDNVRIVGQIANLYILVEKDGGLLIIDQHAAHERIFYDIIKKRENVSVQELISPVVIDLTPKEKMLMDEYIPYLEEVGFGISEFGDYSYAVSFVPIVFGRMENVSTVHDFIADLLSIGKIKDETGIRDAIAKRTACRAAIKSGASCSREQMEELIRQLKQTENPYSCPHGRPTILIFSQKELEKLFERS